jgi:hypothetical protein
LTFAWAFLRARPSTLLARPARVYDQNGKGAPMVRIELSDADAEILREMLAHKLHDIAIEINRTDRLEFKEMLRQTEHALDRLVQQLPEKNASRET